MKRRTLAKPLASATSVRDILSTLDTAHHPALVVQNPRMLGAKGRDTLADRLRAADLTKLPGVAETLDWASALVVLGAPELSPEVIV